MIAVSTAALRRAGTAVADLPPLRAPVAEVDPGWATTTALAGVVTSATGQLAALHADVHRLAEALTSAALAYERCDQDVAGRFR